MLMGALRHQVSVLAPTRVRSSSGGWTDSFAEVAKVPASLTPVGSGEYLRGGADTGTITHRVRVRYRALTVRHRLAIGSRTFLIRSVQNTGERNEELVLSVEELV